MRRATLAAVTAVTLFAAGLRLTAPFHGLPCDAEPDIYTVRQVERLRSEGLTDRYLAGWRYPLLFGTLTAALPWEAPDPDREAPLADHLRSASAAHRWTRLVCAVASIAAVPLTLLLALRFMGLGGATLAALLLATSGLHTWMSVQARPHAPTAAVVVLALLACARWFERGRTRDGVLAGVAVGLSATALHSGAIAGIPLALVGAILLIRRGPRTLVGSLAAGVLALAFVVWGYGLEPHEPRDWYTREAALFEQAGVDTHHVPFGGHLMRDDLFNGRGFSVLFQGFRELDPILGAAACLGLLVALVGLLVPRVRRAVDGAGATVVAATFVPFLLVFGLYELSYDRFFLPIYPLFALLGALGLQALAGAFGLGRRGRVIGATLVLALPALTSSRIAWLVTQPSAHTLVTEAVRAELDGTARSAALAIVEPVSDWSPERLVSIVPPMSPNRWLTYQRRRLDEWGSLPLGLDAVPVALDAGRALAPDPTRSEKLTEFLLATSHDVLVLATSWHNHTGTQIRTAEVADWRAALEAAGWQKTQTIAPVRRHEVEGCVPFVDLPSLFRRTSLGDRHDIYERIEERRYGAAPLLPVFIHCQAVATAWQ